MKEESSPGKEVAHPMFSAFPPPRQRKGKIVTAEEAVRVIRDGDTVATGGFVGAGFAEEVAVKPEEYFLNSGRPKNFTLVYAAGQGDGVEKGLNHMGPEGLVRTVIGGHIGLAPKLQKLVRENKILAYNSLQACPRPGVGGLWDSRAGREARETPNRHDKNSGMGIRNPLDAL
jgi:hypothetical protein